MRSLSYFLFILFLSKNSFSQVDDATYNAQMTVQQQNYQSFMSQCLANNGTHTPCVDTWYRNEMASCPSGLDQACSSMLSDVISRGYQNQSSDDGGAESGFSTGTSTPSKECTAQIPITEKYCKSLTWMNESATGQIANGLISAFTAAQSAGNTKAACESAKKINTISTGLNGAAAALCYKSVKTCITACSTKTNANNEENLKTCEKYNTYAQLATAQAVQSASAMLGSQACADAASGDCVGEKAFTNSICQEFCFKVANAQHPKCLNAAANCQNPNYAAQNVQQCTCIANPLSPSCRTATGSPVPTTTASVPNLGEDGIGAGDYDFNGANAEGSAAKANAVQGGGGGFGGGGSSSPFGEGGGGGPSDDPFNKEILTGTGGAAGGAAGIFGGGGYAEGGSRGGRPGTTGEEKGLDLSQFLPGGKKDPRRNPASAGYADPTITKANGLTNWQKVTRKINEKRPELAP